MRSRRKPLHEQSELMVAQLADRELNPLLTRSTRLRSSLWIDETAY